MGRRGTGLALMAGLLLAACDDSGGVPIYVGGDLVTTIGGPAPTATVVAADGTVAEAPADDDGFRLNSIFASDGTPVYIGGRRVNCPDDQPDC